MKKILSVLLTLLMLSTLLVPSIMANAYEIKGPTPSNGKLIDGIVISHPSDEKVPTYYDYISKEWEGRIYLTSVVHKDSQAYITYSGWAHDVKNAKRSIEVRVEGDRGVIAVHDNPLAPRMKSLNLFIDMTK